MSSEYYEGVLWTKVHSLHQPPTAGWFSVLPSHFLLILGLWLIGSYPKSQKGIIFKALDLGIDSGTPAGKLVIGIFAALAEYDREMILEKTRAGQLLAKVKGKHIGQPSGMNQENYQKVKKAIEKDLSVSEIVSLTGISLSSVKRYRKLIGKDA